MSFLNLQPVPQLSNFLDLIQKSSCSPFGSFTIRTTSLQSENVKRFLTMCGPTLESLHISLELEPNLGSSGRLSFTMTDIVQIFELIGDRLKILKIDICGAVNPLTIFWNERIPDETKVQ